MQLIGLKSLLRNYIIIKEWIENGEFDGADKIVVVSTRCQAVIINILFEGHNKKIYYCTKLHGKYKYFSKTKWIVFDRSQKQSFPSNDYNVLHIPVI